MIYAQTSINIKQDRQLHKIANVHTRTVSLHSACYNHNKTEQICYTSCNRSIFKRYRSTTAAPNIPS